MSLPSSCDERFVELVEYKTKFGHCNVPLPSTTEHIQSLQKGAKQAGRIQAPLEPFYI